jgi:hypothetical protein
MNLQWIISGSFNFYDFYFLKFLWDILWILHEPSLLGESFVDLCVRQNPRGGTCMNLDDNFMFFVWIICVNLYESFEWNLYESFEWNWSTYVNRVFFSCFLYETYISVKSQILLCFIFDLCMNLLEKNCRNYESTTCSYFCMNMP